MRDFNLRFAKNKKLREKNILAPTFQNTYGRGPKFCRKVFQS